MTGQFSNFLTCLFFSKKFKLNSVKVFFNDGQKGGLVLKKIKDNILKKILRHQHIGSI
jgi:hypothetical protein